MAAAAPTPAPAAMTLPLPQKAVSSPPKSAGADRKVVPVMVVPDEAAVQVQDMMHVLAVDDSVVDRAVIAKILRSSKYRGKSLTNSSRTNTAVIWEDLVPRSANAPPLV